MAHCGLTAPIPRQPQRCSGQARRKSLAVCQSLVLAVLSRKYSMAPVAYRKEARAADGMWRKARWSRRSASRSAWRERPRRRLPKNALGLDLGLLLWPSARPRRHAWALSPRHRRRTVWLALIRLANLSSRLAFQKPAHHSLDTDAKAVSRFSWCRYLLIRLAPVLQNIISVFRIEDAGFRLGRLVAVVGYQTDQVVRAVLQAPVRATFQRLKHR
jgi:hypothetical protein